MDLFSQSGLSFASQQDTRSSDINTKKPQAVDDKQAKHTGHNDELIHAKGEFEQTKNLKKSRSIKEQVLIIGFKICQVHGLTKKPH